MLKRSFDILFSISLFILASPIILFAIIGILLSSKGPIIYKASRIGKDGNLFTLYKLRTMKKDSGEVMVTTLKNDKRVYPFGNLLRKTKIDELPQLFNIILGDMSVVGPRPEDVSVAEKLYVDKYKKIYDVKPGLTSPASLFDYTHGEHYDSHSEYKKEFLPLKLDLELYYVENNNFAYDLKIIFQTAFTILLINMGKKQFSLPKEFKVKKDDIYGRN